MPCPLGPRGNDGVSRRKKQRRQVQQNMLRRFAIDRPCLVRKMDPHTHCNALNDGENAPAFRHPRVRSTRVSGFQLQSRSISHHSFV